MLGFVLLVVLHALHSNSTEAPGTAAFQANNLQKTYHLTKCVYSVRGKNTSTHAILYRNYTFTQ